MGKNNIFTEQELEKILSAARNSGTRKNLMINYLDVLECAEEYEIILKYNLLSKTARKNLNTEVNKEVKEKKSELYKKFMR